MKGSEFGHSQHERLTVAKKARSRSALSPVAVNSSKVSFKGTDE